MVTLKQLLIIQFTDIALFLCQVVFIETTLSDDDNILDMEGYNFIKVDYPDSIIRGGACLYLKRA